MLGYGWDEVHDEAEVLEHAVSDTLIDRIDRRLGLPVARPARRPHPERRTALRTDRMRSRSSRREAGVALVVTRISDADPAVLRYLAERGIRLDTVLTVDEQRGVRRRRDA